MADGHLTSAPRNAICTHVGGKLSRTMTTEETIVLIVCYLISAAIVYSRTYGLNKIVRQMLTWTPVIGLIYYILKGKNPIDNSLTFGLLTGPIATGLLYELFELLSLRFNKRPFRLHAVSAKDMRGLGLGFPLDSRGYKSTDMLF